MMMYIAIAAGALIAAGVLAELIARTLLRRRGYYILPPHQRVHMGVDKSILPQLEELVRIESNADGERGPEPPTDWSETYRVLVAGGSAAECYLLDQDSEWPAVVRRRLQAEPEKLGASAVHLGNISRSLVPCEAIDMILRKVLPRYKRLDCVALMIGASDVVSWLERGTPPKPNQGEYTVGRVFAEHPEKEFGWSPGKLALRQWLKVTHRALKRPVGHKQNVGGMIGKNRDMRARGEITGEIADPSGMVENFEHWLEACIKTCLTKADRVIVVCQPWLRREFTADEEPNFWNFGQGRPYAEEVTTYYSHDVVNQLMGAVYDASAKVADACGVEKVDLMPVLDHDFKTFYDRLHFTKSGAQVVGDVVADKVLEGVVSSGHAGSQPEPPGLGRSGSTLAPNRI